MKPKGYPVAEHPFGKRDVLQKDRSKMRFHYREKYGSSDLARLFPGLLWLGRRLRFTRDKLALLAHRFWLSRLLSLCS